MPHSMNKNVWSKKSNNIEKLKKKETIFSSKSGWNRKKHRLPKTKLSWARNWKPLIRRKPSWTPKVTKLLHLTWKAWQIQMCAKWLKLWILEECIMPKNRKSLRRLWPGKRRVDFNKSKHRVRAATQRRKAIKNRTICRRLPRTSPRA